MKNSRLGGFFGFRTDNYWRPGPHTAGQSYHLCSAVSAENRFDFRKRARHDVLGGWKTPGVGVLMVVGRKDRLLPFGPNKQRRQKPGETKTFDPLYS
ncbi:MAG: hypothetical protein P8075_17420 [Deltaproteobacteria bacterium]